jgi:hypothetical protein
MMLQFKLTFPTRYTFISINNQENNDSFLKEYDERDNAKKYHCKDKRFNHFVIYLLELSLLTSWDDCS